MELPKLKYSAKNAQSALANRAGNASFPRTARLLKPAEFKRVFRNSKVTSDRYFKVLGCLNEGNYSRLGMAVSRQVDKHAVGRNRIKRVIRESFRQTFGDVNNRPAGDSDGKQAGMDLVVLPRRECATICNSQLALSIDAHWVRIREALAPMKEAVDKQTDQPGSSRENQAAGKK